jgi:Ca-activated chloride channel family protein
VRALSSLDTRGETALYDAVYLSAEHLKQGSRDKKALLLITDGEDNKSRYNLDRVIENLRNSKVAVYAIGLLEEDDTKHGFLHKGPENKAKGVLEKFASTTGGSAYFPRSVDEVDGLCRRIAHDIRSQYTLGYTPTNRRPDGSWRKITVRMEPPRVASKMIVRAKEGYYAPTAQGAAAH